MQTFRHQKFDGRSFNLDEVVFIECHLRDCDLFYSGSDAEWVNTNFENCRFHWRGPAKNMFALMHLMGLLKQGQAAPAIPQSAGVKPN
jgi:uncharacterized protein YjbI with pentapeptide repeats